MCFWKLFEIEIPRSRVGSRHLFSHSVENSKMRRRLVFLYANAIVLSSGMNCGFVGIDLLFSGSHDPGHSVRGGKGPFSWSTFFLWWLATCSRHLCSCSKMTCNNWMLLHFKVRMLAQTSHPRNADAFLESTFRWNILLQPHMEVCVLVHGLSVLERSDGIGFVYSIRRRVNAVQQICLPPLNTPQHEMTELNKAGVMRGVETVCLMRCVCAWAEFGVPGAPLRILTNGKGTQTPWKDVYIAVCLDS